MGIKKHHRRRHYALFASAIAATVTTTTIVLVTPSCSDSATTTTVGLAQGCSINSDCNSPLVCVFGLCHAACNESRDCPQGQRCVQSGKDKVCQLPVEALCSGGAICPTGLACGSDKQCRNVCSSVGDCVTGQLCVTNTCFEASEVDGGGVGLVDAGSDANENDAGCTPPAPNAGPFGFNPSNFDPAAVAAASGVDWANVPDRIIAAANCGNGCLGTPIAVTLSDNSLVDFYPIKNLTIESSQMLTLQGPRSIIVAATGMVDIQGLITVAGTSQDGPPGAGGYPQNGTSQGVGGGGNAVNYPTSAAGGGSFCGIGGKGGGTGALAPGGSTYGTADLIPLLAGSAGGYTAGGDASYSGGALQISARTSIVVRSVGAINMGGSGARGGGAAGGGLLLEAPIITVQGRIAANGGGGGNHVSGAWGSRAYASDVAAEGSFPGANGSAGTQIHGSEGKVDGGALGGGGGGAGRIRFNTPCGNASFETGSIVSPAMTTECATQGRLKY